MNHTTGKHMFKIHDETKELHTLKTGNKDIWTILNVEWAIQPRILL